MYSTKNIQWTICSCVLLCELILLLSVLCYLAQAVHKFNFWFPHTENLTHGDNGKYTDVVKRDLCFWQNLDVLSARSAQRIILPKLSMSILVILVNDQLDAQFFFYMFISILYVFWASSWWSSGESIVSIQHLVYVTLRRWPSSM
jgi:hypothetical protein